MPEFPRTASDYFPRSDMPYHRHRLRRAELLRGRTNNHRLEHFAVTQRREMRASFWDTREVTREVLDEIRANEDSVQADLFTGDE